MSAGEYWYNGGIPNDGLDTSSGTWQGITRSTEPMFRSVPIAPSTGASFTQWYMVNSSRIIFDNPRYMGVISDIGVMPDAFNPDLVLPEGF